MRLELKKLLRQGCIKKGERLAGSISWTTGGSISFESRYTDMDRFLRLSYYTTDYEGNKHDQDYKIMLRFWFLQNHSTMKDEEKTTNHERYR